MVLPCRTLSVLVDGKGVRHPDQVSGTPFPGEDHANYNATRQPIDSSFLMPNTKYLCEIRTRSPLTGGEECKRGSILIGHIRHISLLARTRQVYLLTPIARDAALRKIDHIALHAECNKA